MFFLVRKAVARRLVSRLSVRYSRLPLYLGTYALVRMVMRRRSDRSAVITLRNDERIVVTREVAKEVSRGRS